MCEETPCWYSLILKLLVLRLNLIPFGLGMTAIGWFGLARAVWIPASASAFGVFLIRQYLQTAMPKSMLEAARVDGANDWWIFVRIVLPIARPVLDTLGLPVFVGIWNNTLAAFAVLRESEVQLVTQALGYLAGNTGENGALNLGRAIASLSSLIVFALCTSQLAAGLGLGGSSTKQTWFSSLSKRLKTAWKALSIPDPKSLRGADGICAIACLMVILHHLAQRLDMNTQSQPVRDIKAFLMQGNTGVGAFFVLSGLLLSLPFWRRYLEKKVSQTCSSTPAVAPCALCRVSTSVCSSVLF